MPRNRFDYGHRMADHRIKNTPLASQVLKSKVRRSNSNCLASQSTEFVNLHVDGHQVFAHTGGELYCLEISTGRILWTNPLKGLGFGIATLTTTDAKTSLTAAQAQLIASQHDSVTTSAAAVVAT